MPSALESNAGKEVQDIYPSKAEEAVKRYFLGAERQMNMKIMIGQSRRILSPVYQMQCLLLIGMMQYMFTTAFLKVSADMTSNSEVPAVYETSSQKTSESSPKMADNFDLLHHSFPDNVYLSLHAESKPPTVEVDSIKKNKNGFAYQIKKAEPLYNPIILEAASFHNVDPALVKAIIMAESGYNKRAVSNRGARGLMQLMPRTAKALGVKNIFNPEENIYAGVNYFKSLLNRFGGDKRLALAAYNAGSTNVRRYKGVPPFKATRRYIKKVLEYQRFYKQGPIEKG